MHEWNDRYEQLRGQAFEETSMTGSCRGLALFLQRGTVGWMQAWPQLDPEPACVQKPSLTVPTSVLADLLREQVVGVLAEMILCHREPRKEICHEP